MAKMSIGDRAKRVLTFLYGLSNPRASSALTSSGFTQADFDEGWALLRGLKEVRLAKLPAPANPRTLADLDTWENRWFGIAKATLARHHPAIHDKVFLNLAQASGVDVITSVSTFLTRLGELGQSSDADAQAARTLLATRGLTVDVVADAQRLLDELGTIRQPPPPSTEDPAAIAAREAALWAWYLEWSRIAQSQITDRNVLRQLGFLGPARRPGGGTSDEPDDDDTDDVAPQPVV